MKKTWHPRPWRVVEMPAWQGVEPGSSKTSLVGGSSSFHLSSLSHTMLRRPLLRTASTKVVDPSMYLHRSILPSYYFQDSLPSLPIPTLDVTLQRYLRSLSPLITPEALARTTATVKDFQSGDGLRLNAKLHENVLANPHTSYISEDWFDMYLTTRCVCVLFFYLLCCCF